MLNKGLSHANIYVSIEPYLEGFYYFTDYGSIFLNMIHIENGKWQGVINASFPNGTELALRVFLSYTDSTVSDPVEDPFNSEITIFSDEIKIPIGHIDRSDISQLRIGGISNYVSDNVYENNVFQVRITSNENITSAILLMNSDGRIFNEELHIYYFWENYNYNMIKNSDGIYEAFTPAVNISMVEWINEYKKIIVYNQFKIVATDESVNVAATEGFYFENEIDE